MVSKTRMPASHTWSETFWPIYNGLQILKKLKWIIWHRFSVFFFRQFLCLAQHCRLFSLEEKMYTNSNGNRYYILNIPAQTSSRIHFRQAYKDCLVCSDKKHWSSTTSNVSFLYSSEFSSVRSWRGPSTSQLNSEWTLFQGNKGYIPGINFRAKSISTIRGNFGKINQLQFQRKNWFMLLAVRTSSYGCTREVWRARKKRKSCSMRSREQL